MILPKLKLFEDGVPRGYSLANENNNRNQYLNQNIKKVDYKLFYKQTFHIGYLYATILKILSCVVAWSTLSATLKQEAQDKENYIYSSDYCYVRADKINEIAIENKITSGQSKTSISDDLVQKFNNKINTKLRGDALELGFRESEGEFPHPRGGNEAWRICKENLPKFLALSFATTNLKNNKKDSSEIKIYKEFKKTIYY